MKNQHDPTGPTGRPPTQDCKSAGGSERKKNKKMKMIFGKMIYWK